MSFFTFLTFLLTLQSFVLTVPIIHNPFKSQLVSSNPALSSVYFPSPSSLLLQNTSNVLPALRIPPNWSFSIGLSGDTFLPGEAGSFGDLSVRAQLDNGNPIPYWLIFNSDIMTLSGVAPADVEYNTIRVAASTGDASVSDSFIFIVSPHDIAITTPFKTHNITTGTSFSFVIDDLDSILVDDSSYNMSLSLSQAGPSSARFRVVVDTSIFSWMSWDSASFSLRGTAPQSEDHLILPVTVSASFPDQHFGLNTHLTLNVFTSYFNTSWLPAQHIVPGSSLHLDLAPFVTFKARSDLGWMLSLDNDSSISWITFDPARVSLNGTAPKNLSKNLRVSLTAQHVDRQLTNAISLDLIVDQDSVGANKVKAKRLTYLMSSEVFRRVLGISLAAICVVIMALVSGYFLSRRRTSCKTKVHSGVIGVAYGYQPPKAHPRGPIQRVFDNFSISSSPKVGGKFTTTKDIFDAIRNRFRGERLALIDRLGRSQQQGSLDSFGRDSRIGLNQTSRVCTTLPQRPRKSRIGKPIAVLNGSSGLFNDLIADHVPRVVGPRRPQEGGLQFTKDSVPIAKHLSTFSPPHVFTSQSQFTQTHSVIHSRPPNPVPGSVCSDDVLPPVPSKTSTESPRMKASDFLANKRKAALKSNASSSGNDGMSSSTINKARSLRTSLHHQSSYGSSLPTLKEEDNPNVVGKHYRNPSVHPHFGDSSLEEVGYKSNYSTAKPNRTGQILEVNAHTPNHDGDGGKEETPMDSPNPSTEEYFGSASNESVMIANKARKTATRLSGKPVKASSLAISVPSVYSEDQNASSSFPISSYSIAARQPFAFTLETSNTKAVRPVPKQHNGAELPPWLRFDTSTNEFWGVTPDVKKGNAINVEIDIWDPKTDHVIAGADVEVLG